MNMKLGGATTWAHHNQSCLLATYTLSIGITSLCVLLQLCKALAQTCIPCGPLKLVRKLDGIYLPVHQHGKYCSLVPRLPRSGTRTLKLCRRGEPGIFCHVKSAKDRREVDATLIVRGRMRLRTEKGTKVAANLLHISSYRALNNIHTERWSTVGWKMRKMLPFCLVLFCWRHAYVRKTPGSPRDKYSRSRRAWERGYKYCIHVTFIPQSSHQ